jgi:hypothetical protein
MATITIKQRAPLGRRIIDVEVEADLYGPFAVHPAAGQHDDEPLFTLTHVPTGYAFLQCATKANAEACAQELNAGDLDWSAIAQPSDLSPEHRALGKAMRAKYKDTW